MRRTHAVVYNDCHFGSGRINSRSRGPRLVCAADVLGVTTIMTKRAILVFLLLAGVAGAAVAAPLVDGDADAGKTKSAACAACHGADGNSTSAQFPKLAGQGAGYIVEQLQEFKSGVREDAIMSAQAAALSEQDMKDLAVYFSTQEAKPSVVPDIKQAQAGAKIYHGGAPEFNVPACSGCHGPAGLGNPAADYPRISGQHAEYLVAQLTAYRDGTRGGTDRAEIMQGVTRGLSNQQIEALAAYITGLTPGAAPDGSNNGALLQNAEAPASADKAGDDDSDADSTQG